jgi:hypothetical protein
MLLQCPQSIDVSSIHIEFEQQGLKKPMKKTKKQINEQPWTLANTLVLQNNLALL